MPEIELKDLVKHFGGKVVDTAWSSDVWLTASGQYMAKVKVGSASFVTPLLEQVEDAAGAGFQIVSEMLEMGV